jgi:protein farnesyltransferase subunit beta
LSGLSTTEYFHCYGKSEEIDGFSSALSWKAAKKRPHPALAQSAVFDDGTSVLPMHPVYAIPHEAVTAFRDWSVQQPQFNSEG